MAMDTQISREYDWSLAEPLLRDWLRRARESQHSHHEAGKFCLAANYWLSVPVVVITTILGTTAFASIQREVSGRLKIAFGAVSMVAAVLSGLQIHFQFGRRSASHKSLGARYGNIRREIEELLALPASQRGDPKKALGRIRSRTDALSSEGYVVSRKIFEQTIRDLAKRDMKRAQRLDCFPAQEKTATTPTVSR